MLILALLLTNKIFKYTMKSTFLKLFGLFIVGALTLTSCDPDEPTPTEGPKLTVLSGTEHEGKSFLPNVDLTFTISGTQGTALLNSFSVLEDGAAVSTGRLLIDNNVPNANPFLLLEEGDDEQFTFVVVVTTNSASGTYDLAFTVTDAEQNSSTYTLEYTVVQPNVVERTGVLFNQGGPAGTGGLNLETGAGTGSTDGSAHIRDLGIDTNLPVNNNWIQKIAPITANGVTLRQAASEVSFETINFTNQLEGIYNGGTEIGANGGANKVQVGDIFVARQGDKYYAFVIREVNVTSGNDNNDNYVIDIKRQ